MILILVDSIFHEYFVAAFKASETASGMSPPPRAFALSSHIFISSTDSVKSLDLVTNERSPGS